ncbi:MAG: S53 family peptidase [Candidatus Vogelbacteria bacterium]|nr:S53 family peptidase [Candidatus Vogelbacteria bacterium]
MKMKKYYFALILFVFPLTLFARTSDLDSFRARPPIHIFGPQAQLPQGITPDKIKIAYHLPKDGGKGTIAIIDAFDSPMIEHDLGVFDKTFSLVDCTLKNKCLEVHKMSSKVKTDSGWAGETALDVEWAHAVAPHAKILLIEALTDSGTNLLKAVDYARNRSDVVAVSMSWGGGEFSGEDKLDTHFMAKSGVTFFASSGDNGAGVSWPAVSSKVVAVGGTTLVFKADGTVSRELGWDGSGGGVSAYIPEPAYQKDYKIPRDKNMRGIPDVSYNADPATGFSVYLSNSTGRGAWQIVGGTSAGAPQWAAIRALGSGVSNEIFYADKAKTNNKGFFRDITSGSNGDCTYFCDARAHYDYVTGLGSPQTSVF